MEQNVKLWMVIRIKTEEKKAPETKEFSRTLKLPFIPVKDMVLIEEGEIPWLFVVRSIGYNITNAEFNCEYVIDVDDVKYQTVSNALLKAGWEQAVDK